MSRLFYKETSTNAQKGPRSLLHDPFETSGGILLYFLLKTNSPRQISGNWRWCSAERQEWSQTMYRRTSSVTPMLQHLQWPTLQEHRAHAKVTMMYRTVNGLGEVPTSNLTTIISARGHVWTLLHGTICKHLVLPAILLPRHHPNLEQPSPVSCKLYNHWQLHERSTLGSKSFFTL